MLRELGAWGDVAKLGGVKHVWRVGAEVQDVRGKALGFSASRRTRATKDGIPQLQLDDLK